MSALLYMYLGGLILGLLGLIQIRPQLQAMGMFWFHIGILFIWPVTSLTMAWKFVKTGRISIPNELP